MLNLGIIGCGKVTTMFHLKAIKAVDNLVVKAVSDIDDKSMQRVQKACGADRCYRNYLEMLDDPDIPAVVVCTPPRLHSEMVLRAVEKGKHVLCEKPLAKTRLECLEIKKASEKHDVVVLPVHNYVFTPALASARSLIHNDAIGAVKKVNIRFQNSLSLYRPRTDFRLKQSMGIIEDLLPHALSVSTWVMGRVAEVRQSVFMSKKYDVPDNAFVGLMTENGIPLDITLSWTKLIPCFRTDFVGTKGEIELDLMRSPNSLKLTSHGNNTKIRLVEGFREYMQLLRLEHPAFAKQYLHFLRVVEGEERPLVTLEDETNIVQTIENLTSILENRPKDGGIR